MNCFCRCFCSRDGRAGLLRGVLVFFVMALALGCGGSSKKSTTGPDPDADDDRPTSRRSSAPDIGEGDDSDGMAVEGLSGRMEVYDIQKGMEPHLQALTDCFVSRVKKRRYVGGEVEFKFVVHADGTVKTVTVQRSDLGAWPIEQCMLDINQKIRFPKPKGNAEADFTVPLAFDARQRTAEWNEARTDTEVAKLSSELAACADSAGVDEPENVWIAMYVGTRGKVLSAGFASPDAPLDAGWATCAAGVVEGWSLTDPRGQITKAGFRYNASE